MGRCEGSLTMNCSHVFICILIFVSAFSRTDAIAAMSIDLGSEFMKIAIVMPGKPMEVALDSESKRKTPTAIAFRGNDRLFGRAAVNVVTRSPESVFQTIPALIGKTLDHPAVKVFQKRYPYHNLTYDDTTGQLVLSHPNGMSFTVEELVGMLMERAREIAEAYADKGTSLRSVVLTTPSFCSQAERRSLIRAAELAGLDVIQLVNANSAVALNFGVFRHTAFNDTYQYYMFFDVGYSSTTATVVSYHVGKHHQDGVAGEDPILTIVGVGSAPTLGTSAFIHLLRDNLADKFRKAKPHIKADISLNQKAMAKLTQEAVRVFTTLSANSEVVFQVESLFEGEDFKGKISRKEMETFCAAEFEKLRQPFADALESSKIELSSIQEIVLMGGGTRVPKIQSILMELGKRSDLGKGVNSDEAAVMGAVYQAATRTPGFKVLRFVLREYNPYPIAVDFERAPTLAAKEEKPAPTPDPVENSSPFIRRVLFPRGNPYPQKRAITFNRHSDDLSFFINYVDLTAMESLYVGLTNLSRAATRGVAGAVQQHQQAEMRGVKAHFTLDYSGLLVLTGVDCLLHPIPGATAESQQDESTLTKLGSTISGFFGLRGGSSEGAADANATEPIETNTTASETPNSTDTANVTKPSPPVSPPTAVNETKPTTPPKSLAPFTHRISFELVYLDSAQPTDDHRSTSKEKLRALRKVDQDKYDLEHSMNQLESTLFSTRDQMESDNFKQYCTEEELTTLSNLVSQYTEWYDEQSVRTAKDEFDDRFHEIRKRMIPIELRLREAETRPSALKEIAASIEESTKFLDLMRDTMEKLAAAQPKPTVNTADAVTEPEANSTTETPPKETAETPKDTEASSSWPSLFTDTEQKTLQNMIEDTKSWTENATQQFAAMSLTDRPPILVSEIDGKQRRLKRELQYLSRKLAAWKMEMERLMKLHAEQTTTTSTPAAGETTASTVKEDKPADSSQSPFDSSKPIKTTRTEDGLHVEL